MDQGQLNWITNFIWGIADDVLRDVYVRGKYRDVILPMVVLRRLDAVLEPTKQAVQEQKARLDKAKITNQDGALRSASKQAFYNTSPFTLRDLKAHAKTHQLKADFEAYLDGFSPNVQDILNAFEFRNQIPRLSKADSLGTIIERMLDPQVNLGPSPVNNPDGTIKHPGLDNHAMGTIFEELVRRFNEENNEEAGEHWTPRDAVKLMAELIFRPIADEIESGTYLVYDGACGTGGMLTVAEETLQRLAKEHGKQVSTHLFGQEIVQDDVFARLLTFPNVVITAHQPFFTRKVLDHIAQTTLQKITNFERGGVKSENHITSGNIIARSVVPDQPSEATTDRNDPAEMDVQP